MKWDVVVLDAPHTYNQRNNWEEHKFRGGASSKYDFMSPERVGELPIDSVLASPGVVLSWTTIPLIPETLGYMGGWNAPIIEQKRPKYDRLKYSTVFLQWVKVCRGRYRSSPDKIRQQAHVRGIIGLLDWLRVFGVGFWTKSNGELCWLFSRGKRALTPAHNTVSNLLFAPQTRIHSEKPWESLDKAVELFGPDRTYLELFSRHRQPGWFATGEEYDGRDVFEFLEWAAAEPGSPETYRELISDPSWRSHMVCQYCGVLHPHRTPAVLSDKSGSRERWKCRECGYERWITVG